MKHKWNQIKKVYNNFHIQTKLTISYLLVVTIPVLIVGVFFLFRLYDMVTADAIRREQNATLSVAPVIEKQVEQIMDYGRELTETPYFTELTSRERTMSLHDLSLSENAAAFNDTAEKLIQDTFIEDVKLYIDEPPTDESYITGSVYDRLLTIENAKGTYWHGIFSGSPSQNTLLCPPFYLSGYETEHYGDFAYITKFTIKQNNNYYSSYLAIYFSEDIFSTVLKDSLASSNNTAYLINSRNSTFASTASYGAGAYYFNYDEVNEYFSSSNSFIEKTVMGQDVYAGFYKIKNSDWFLVLALPSEPIIQSAHLIVFTMFGLYVFFTLLVFLLARKLSNSLTLRIAAVSKEMSKAKHSLPVALPPSDSTDEIGTMMDSYNHMTETIHKLVDDQMRSAEELRVAEFNTLQAQINPHFLYNTMEMINWLAQQGKPEEVSQAILKLSRYYKLTLNKEKRHSTIEEELEHITIYVELQNMRFHDKIDLVVDIPDELLEQTIPRLTFQPIIENAVLHGILEKDSKEGTIVVTGWCEDDIITILICDDGVGMDEQTLKSIFSADKINPGKGSNIAVSNTHRRLQILYGKDYGLKYRSMENGGTEVEISIPVLL